MVLQGVVTGAVIGGYELLELLGEGGMGVVYRARRIADGRLFALKLITTAFNRRHRFHRAFVREVQSMARLDHPGIVAVRDFGTLTDTPGLEAFQAAPFLVMDLFEAGSLKQSQPPLDWDVLRALLLGLLDALAHAHAQGIIHRDLKPANIMWQLTDGELEVCLTDFGIARAMAFDDPLDDRELEERVTGTPRYMAPEQVLGQWRDEGPWTDLYALGVLAWNLACGRTPFDGETTRILRAHLAEPPPPFAPRFPVPPDLGAWLEKMLAKAPLHRFRRAADAAQGLLSLGPAPGVGSAAPLALPDLPTLCGLTDPVTPLADVGAADGGAVPVGPADGRWPRPRAPQDWRPGNLPQADLARHGLFGLRAVPLVGRDREQHLLWEELRAVDAGATRVVVVRGLAGMGKSRLAEWLVTRAHEVGVTQTFRMTHTASGTLMDGLPGLVARAFRSTGLDRPGTRERVHRFFAQFDDVVGDVEHDIDMLTDVALGASLGDAPRLRETYMAIARVIEHAARERPVILLVDDVQWGMDAVPLIRCLARDWPALSGRSLPLLILATLRGDAEFDARALQPLCDEEVELGPLPPAEQAAFVRSLLAVPPEFAAEVARRTEGNPLFAYQWVSHAIEHGLIVDTGSDYRIDRAELPTSVHHTWVSRVEHVLALAADPAQARRALIVGAILGRSVDAPEWNAVLTALGNTQGGEVLEPALRSGLIVRSENGWSFAHALLRDSLLRLADEDHVRVELEAACAANLQRVHEVPTFASCARIGAHWEAAGRIDLAVDAYMAAIERTHTEVARRAEALCEHTLTLLDRTGAAEHDHRRAQVLYAIASVAPRGAIEHRAACLVQAIHVANDGQHHVDAETAREPARAEILARVMTSLSKLRDLQGDVVEALVLSTKSVEIARRSGSDFALATALSQKAMLHVRRGQIAEALTYAQEGLQAAERTDNSFAQLLLLSQLSRVHDQAGDHARAAHFSERALRLAERTGSRTFEAEEYYYAGERARALHRVDEARLAYLRAADLYAACGDSNAELCRMVLAWFDFDEGAYTRPRALLERALARIADLGLEYTRHYLQLALCVCDGAEARWDDWDRNFVAAEGLLKRTGEVHRDLALAAEHAGVACQAASPARAVQAWQLAADQWRRLDEPERAETLLTEVARLAAPKSLT